MPQGWKPVSEDPHFAPVRYRAAFLIGVSCVQTLCCLARQLPSTRNSRGIQVFVSHGYIVMCLEEPCGRGRRGNSRCNVASQRNNMASRWAGGSPPDFRPLSGRGITRRWGPSKILHRDSQSACVWRKQLPPPCAHNMHQGSSPRVTGVFGHHKPWKKHLPTHGSMQQPKRGRCCQIAQHLKYAFRNVRQRLYGRWACR